MDARTDHLVKEGLARRFGERTVFERGMLDTLRKRELDAIRAWCVENDIEVNMNGRIADAPIQAFYARKSA